MGGLGRDRREPTAASRLLGERLSRYPTLSPSQGCPCLGDNDGRSCFRRPEHRAGEGASQGRAGRPARSSMYGEAIPRSPPRSQSQTSPFLPLNPPYTPTSRPTGARFDPARRAATPPPAPFSLPLTPPRRPEPWRRPRPATGSTSESARLARSSRHHPHPNASSLSAAPAPAQMLQTPLTCIDAMMEPSPPGPARPETQGAELPCSRHAAGAQHPGRGGGASDGKGMGASGLAGARGPAEGAGP